MEIYQLKVFLEVARTLSFTEAADALNLTQPAVSAKIKSLETSLGTDLFHRLGRKVKLTPVGEYLLQSGPGLIALEHQLVKEIEAIKQGKSSRLTIGSTTSIIDGWIPDLLFKFHRQYPYVEINTLCFSSIQELHKTITEGRIDIGFSEVDLEEFSEISSTPIDQFNYSLLVAADHRLAQSQWLRLKDLTSETWVFPAPDTPERLALENRLTELGLQLSDFTNYEIAQSPSLMSTFLRQGHYLGFASSFQLQTERQSNLLVSVPLQEFALNAQLFLLLPQALSQIVSTLKRKPKNKTTKKARSSKGVASKPLTYFIQMVEEQHQHRLQRHYPPRPQMPFPRTVEGATNKEQLGATHKEQLGATNKGQLGATNKGQSKRFTAVPDLPIFSKPEPSVSSTNVEQSVERHLHALPKIAYFKAPPISTRPIHSGQAETLTVTIGTQNKTIQTVTAGLIIERLGLLEHFLPRGGRYSKTQYCIKWCNFTSGAPIVKGLRSQQLDIGILGDYPLLLSGINSPHPGSDVSGFDVSGSDVSGADGSNADAETTQALAKTRLVSFVASNPDGAGNTIIVPNRSPLKELNDLRDRSIAVPFSSSAHGMIMRTLAQASLLQEVTLSSIHNLNLHQLTPRKTQADGYAYFAPLHEMANSHGHFRRLIDPCDLVTLPTFHGVVVQDTLADRHPDIVVAYLKALIAAQHWYVTTPNALSLVSDWTRLAPEIVAKTLEYADINAPGLFFPETTIRLDWIAEHINQLKSIPGNQTLGKINMTSWIQPEFLETAVNAF